jgi:hypothetical protein
MENSFSKKNDNGHVIDKTSMTLSGNSDLQFLSLDLFVLDPFQQ